MFTTRLIINIILFIWLVISLVEKLFLLAAALNNIFYSIGTTESLVKPLNRKFLSKFSTVKNKPDTKIFSM